MADEEEWNPWLGEDERAALLVDIDDDLVDAANSVLNSLSWLSSPLNLNPLQSYWYDEAMRRFRMFSGHSIGGLDELKMKIDDLLQHHFPQPSRDVENPDPPVSLVNARRKLEDGWEGGGAENAKDQLTGMERDFQFGATAMAILMSDLRAARDVIYSAREDLKTLADILRDAQEQHSKEKRARQEGMVKVLAEGAVATVGSAIADGWKAAVGAAAEGLGSLLIETTSLGVTGSSAEEIAQSFLGNADDLAQATTELAEELVEQIKYSRNSVQDWSLTAPPDVSPGKRFDAEDFFTPRLPDDIRDAVNDRNIDIPARPPGSEAAGGSVSHIGARLAGGSDEPTEQEDAQL